MRSTMWLTFLTFLMAHLFAVVVSESSVQAFVGTNALLPCDCPAKKSLSWQDANNLVITGISEDGYEANHPQFINRTQLFKHRDENNCSLLILGVKVEDQGKYACHSLRPLHTEFVELKVMAKYSPVCTRNNDELVCKANNGYPKGKIYWQDGQHVFNSSETTTKEDGSTRLFNLKCTLKRIMGVNVKCIVEMPVETIIVDCLEDKVSEQRLYKLNDSSWAIGVAVISTLVVALGVLVVYLSYRRKWARVMNDHVESHIESDETEESPLERVRGISAECRAHQYKTHMTTES